MKGPVLAMMAAASLIFANCRSESPDPPMEAPEFLDYGDRFGGDFELTDHNEELFRLADHRGSVFLIFFGYTYCPDACPLTLSKLAAVYPRLELEEDQQVRTIYITVDPERDTAKQLKEYLAFFSSVDALGLTGSKEEIDRVAEQYGVLYKYQEPNESGHYLVAHTTTLFLVDSEGRLRYRFHSDDSPDYIATGVEMLF